MGHIDLDKNPDFTTFDSWGVDEWRHAFRWMRVHEEDAIHLLATLTKELAVAAKDGEA